MLIAAVVVAAAGCGLPSEPRAARPTSTPTRDATPTTTRTPLPPPPLPWGPTQDQFRRASQAVAAMSVEQQAGQVIVAEYKSAAQAEALVQDLHLGGLIVMHDEPAQRLRRHLADLQAAAAGRGYPLVIGVDQEGGSVARVSPPATEFPSFMTLGAARNPRLARRAAHASGEELRALGFTMVSAPVADVTMGPADPTIGSRSPGSDPELVADVVGAAVRGYADAGIVPVVKHFPGHGSVPADSHVELPVQRRGWAEIYTRDLIPFRAAVAARVPAVMVGHIDVRDLDPGVPSSLSPAVIQRLRFDVGFDGVVVTDAQNMAAITGRYGAGAAAVRSLAAGADLILMPADVRSAHAEIVEAVAEGRLPAARLADAATRVVALMMRQGEEPLARPVSVVGSNGAVSYAVSLAGLTVVSGPCRGRLVGAGIEIVGGTQQDRSRLAEAAAAAGVRVGRGGDVVRMLGSDRPDSGDIVVALDEPYGLARSTATTARIALFGRTPHAFRALVYVLTGTAVAHGKLPVNVQGLEQRCGDHQPG